VVGLKSDVPNSRNRVTSRDIVIPPLGLGGTLHLPAQALGLVVFAHGSGSSRFSSRNMAVAHALNVAGFGTLLFDLLTPGEENDRANVFDIQLLAGRLVHAIRWNDNDPELSGPPLGLFGASTGAAAALVAAVRRHRPERTGAGQSQSAEGFADRAACDASVSGTRRAGSGQPICDRVVLSSS
jgi:hypothetical protein